jgi:hypothetical protein
VFIGVLGKVYLSHLQETLEFGTYRPSRNVSKLPTYITSYPKTANASSQSFLQGLLYILCSSAKKININLSYRRQFLSSNNSDDPGVKTAIYA